MMDNKIIKLYDCFDGGNFKVAFIGSDELHFRDYTWGGHDTLLVFYHLFKWLQNGNNTKENIEKIKASLYEIITTDKSVNPINKGLESLQLLLSYCIKAEGINYWPIDKSFISELITQIPINKENYSKFNIERDINNIKQYLGIYLDN